MTNQTIQPPQIKTVSDIRRVLVALDPIMDLKSDSQTISTQINAGGVVATISARTSGNSDRQYIINGLEVIRSRQQICAKKTTTDMPVVVNGRPMQPVDPINCDGRLSVDGMIERLLGASRSGLTIYWDLSDGYRYEYDIYTHSLSRQSQ